MNDCKQAARQLQLIVPALAVGVIVYMAIVYFNRPAHLLAARPLMISYLMAGFAVLSIVAWFVVPQVIVRGVIDELAATSPPTDPRARLLAVYIQRTIVACALLEAAALANVSAFWLQQWMPSLVISGVLTLGILIHLPTTASISEWIDEQTQNLAKMPTTRFPRH